MVPARPVSEPSPPPAGRTARTGRCGPRTALLGALLVLVAGCTAGSLPAVAAPGSAGASVTAPTGTAAKAPAPAATTPDPSTAGRTSGPPAGSTGPDTPAPTTTAPTPGGCDPAAACLRAGPAHRLAAGLLAGGSGLVAAGRPGILFAVDDHPGTAEIVAIDTGGRLVQRMPVAGLDAANAEALTAGRCPSGAGRCLYVGDIGDNSAARDSVVVSVLAEPDPLRRVREPLPARHWSYRYADGPHNAEAMVLSPDGDLVVITKSARSGSGAMPAHRIYRGAPGGGVLALVRSFRPPEPVVPLQSALVGTVVTDAGYDGRRLLLLTYDEIIEYRAPTRDADPQDFPSWPHAPVPAPRLIQSEGIAADLHDCGYSVLSEAGPFGDDASLATVSCLPR